jgi:hypothetical protein
VSSGSSSNSQRFRQQGRVAWLPAGGGYQRPAGPGAQRAGSAGAVTGSRLLQLQLQPQRGAWGAGAQAAALPPGPAPAAPAPAAPPAAPGLEAGDTPVMQEAQGGSKGGDGAATFAAAAARAGSQSPPAATVAVAAGAGLPGAAEGSYSSSESQWGGAPGGGRLTLEGLLLLAGFPYPPAAAPAASPVAAAATLAPPAAPPGQEEAMPAAAPAASPTSPASPTAATATASQPGASPSQEASSSSAGSPGPGGGHQQAETYQDSCAEPGAAGRTCTRAHPASAPHDMEAQRGRKRLRAEGMQLQECHERAQQGGVWSRRGLKKIQRSWKRLETKLQVMMSLPGWLASCQ